MNILKAFVYAIVIMIGIGLGATIVRGLSTYNTPTPTTSEETYMGLTRQEYLDTVSNNGQDKAAECTYANLIDNYGLRETYMMDVEATKSDTVDDRIYVAMEGCL